MVIFMRIPYNTWNKYANYILFFCYLLLVLVLVPGIGMVRGGAQRWIGVGAFSIQPSEFMKLVLFIFLSVFLSSNLKFFDSFYIGLFCFLILLLSTFWLISF